MEKAIIYISGVIGSDKGEIGLTDIIRQFKSYEDPEEEIEVVIRSIGGNVNEGNAMYDYLEGLKKDFIVNTSTSKAYSIAAKLFSVGEKRIIEDTEKVLFLHLPWIEVKGSAEKLENVAESLRVIESDFADFYSDFLDVDKTTAINLLDNNTFMSGEEAVELGFATETKTALKAVAIYNEDIKPIKNKMKKGKLAIFKEGLSSLVNALFEGEINALVLQDSNANEINFEDLETGDTLKVGDKGTIDGVAVKDGSYIIPSLEDITVVFVDGAITEIIPKDDGESEEDKKARLLIEAAEAAKAAKAEELKEVWTNSVEIVSTGFEEGDIVIIKGWGDGDDYTASAGEFNRADGTSIVTDASGKIVKVKPASDDSVIEAQAKAEIEDLIKAAEVRIETKYEVKIKALNKLIGSKEFQAKITDPKDNTSPSDKERTMDEKLANPQEVK